MLEQIANAHSILDNTLTHHRNLSRVLHERAINRSSLTFLVTSLESQLSRMVENQVNSLHTTDTIPGDDDRTFSVCSASGLQLENVSQERKLYLEERNRLLSERVVFILH